MEWLTEALQYVQEHLGTAKAFTEDEDLFDRHTYRAPLPVIPTAKTRTVSTLGAFAEYVMVNPDALASPIGLHWIHVESPSRVAFICPPNDNREREVPLVADCPIQDVSRLDRFLPPDDFIPSLLAMSDAGDREKILKMMREVTRERFEVVEDDLGGQSVKTERKGGPKGWTPQDNPLSLAPWSTFPEVAQPLRLFLVRWNPEGQFKLVPSPDERWRLEAVASVKADLQLRLSKGAPPILA